MRKVLSIFNLKNLCSGKLDHIAHIRLQLMMYIPSSSSKSKHLIFFSLVHQVVSVPKEWACITLMRVPVRGKPDTPNRLTQKVCTFSLKQYNKRKHYTYLISINICWYLELSSKIMWNISAFYEEKNPPTDARCFSISHTWKSKVWGQIRSSTRLGEILIQ